MNPYMLGAALGRMVTIQCPYCRFKKLVDKTKPAHHRVCPKCHKQYPDPLAKKKR